MGKRRRGGRRNVGGQGRWGKVAVSLVIILFLRLICTHTLGGNDFRACMESVGLSSHNAVYSILGHLEDFLLHIDLCAHKPNGNEACCHPLLCELDWLLIGRRRDNQKTAQMKATVYDAMAVKGLDSFHTCAGHLQSHKKRWRC